VTQPNIAFVIIAVIVLLAIIVFGWWYSRRRRTRQLRERFGPEYDRVVRQQGNPYAKVKECWNSAPGKESSCGFCRYRQRSVPILATVGREFSRDSWTIPEALLPTPINWSRK